MVVGRSLPRGCRKLHGEPAPYHWARWPSEMTAYGDLTAILANGSRLSRTGSTKTEALSLFGRPLRVPGHASTLPVRARRQHPLHNRMQLRIWHRRIRRRRNVTPYTGTALADLLLQHLRGVASSLTTGTHSELIMC